MATVLKVKTNVGKTDKKKNSKDPDKMKYVNERLQKNYGKTNRQMSTSTSVEPGVRDTPALKALRDGDQSTVSKNITVKASGRPSGEKYALQKMREKGILDENNKVINKKPGKKVVLKVKR